MGQFVTASGKEAGPTGLDCCYCFVGRHEEGAKLDLGSFFVGGPSLAPLLCISMGPPMSVHWNTEREFPLSLPCLVSCFSYHVQMGLKRRTL